jgi:hypothetical protein
MKALAIAATGMNAQQTNLEVIANNIANINTTGFKRARAEFTDLLYQVDRMQGVPNRANSSIVPEGVSIGLGVKTAAVRNLHIQGSKAMAKANLLAPFTSSPIRKVASTPPTTKIPGCKNSTATAISLPVGAAKARATANSPTSPASP